MKPASIVILTGAGISAESGLPTFRDKDGLWEGHRVEDVASPAGFRRDPELVHRFYNLRRAALYDVTPNAAHIALARLQREYAGRVTLITQNVDDLHERAGSEDVIHMHGELRKARCTHCERVFAWDGDLETTTPCPKCGGIGGMRPDIVWFGEIPYHMERIGELLHEADCFAAIGTSGHVHPAAGFVSAARFAGADTIEINNAGTLVSGSFHRHLTGPATSEVPRWVAGLLEGLRDPEKNDS
jgi:NAD-dependent deacetylase